jgi:phosphatidylglycerol:prolipoprotein diacylglycerol transferase
MRPIPVVFHIGPLQVHTYGIGLALTFWFGFTYFERRLKRYGYRTDWFVGVFLWIILSAVVGARALHVLSNLSYYTHSPDQVLAIWHGGLSSFGGLLFAVPTGIILTHRRCPELPIGRALDIIAPVLLASWAMGRLLGPQLMVAGGGHPTHQWFGMYYAGQAGRRLPVPIFQALEDFSVFLVLIFIERRLDHWPDGSIRSGYPTGTVIGTAMVLWGIERALDEHLWLGEDGHLGSLLVQIAGVLLVVGERRSSSGHAGAGGSGHACTARRRRPMAPSWPGSIRFKRVTRPAVGCHRSGARVVAVARNIALVCADAAVRTGPPNGPSEPAKSAEPATSDEGGTRRWVISVFGRWPKRIPTIWPWSRPTVPRCGRASCSATPTNSSTPYGHRGWRGATWSPPCCPTVPK